MKKLLSLIVVGALAASMVAGCSSDTSEEETTAADENADSDTESEASSEDTSNEGRTLTIMASQDWIKDVEMELSDQFTEETGIIIDYQIIPSDQYTSLVTTKLNSGECADIFMYQSGKFDIQSLLQIEENAVDLSDQEWVSRFADAAKEQVSVDGKCYGVTFWDVGDSYAYIYNKTIFEQYDLEVPTTLMNSNQYVKRF